MLGGSIIKCLWLIMKPVLETLLIILAVVSVRSKLSPQGNLRRSNGGMMQQPERVNKKLGMFGSASAMPLWMSSFWLLTHGTIWAASTTVCWSGT